MLVGKAGEAKDESLFSQKPPHTHLFGIKWKTKTRQHSRTDWLFNRAVKALSRKSVQAWNELAELR
jgi:hypothetical protein